MKFCSECGASLQNSNSKFCPQCGACLQPKVAESTPVENTAQVQPPAATPQRPKPVIDEEFTPIKLKAYDLGVQLEDTTASIFGRMGYSVEKRRRLPTRSGATAEIDILLVRGNRTIIVECKNYDPSRSVGASDLRIFKDKLVDTGILSGVFVTNTYFSEDAEKLADSVGMELWDGDKHKEMFYAYAIGRIKNPSLLQDPILPLNLDFMSASSLSLRNNAALRLFSAVLLYHPYIVVKYRLLVTRKDPTGKLHKISKEGVYFIDALDGDIINREKGIIENISVLFKKKEMRMESREDKMVSEDLDSIEPASKPVLNSNDYRVSVAEPEVNVEEAVKIVKSFVVEMNMRKVSYDIKKKGETETRTLKIVPRLDEVDIRGTRLVFVPKWNLEYEAGQTSYSKRLLASSSRILEDDLAKCRKCTILKKSTIAVCEVCGVTLCEKHAYQEGRWLCENHISDGLRNQLKGRGLMSKLGLRH